MAAKGKSFLHMTPAERAEAVKNLDREISFDETKPLSAKAQALWERAKGKAPDGDEARQEKLAILADAKKLARRYYSVTGRPLGVTGEIAEFEAIRLLNLDPAPVRQAGYDAVIIDGGQPKKVQIKGRCVQCGGGAGQRLGRIQLDKEWDAVLLVLLDANFDAVEMYQAERAAVAEALTRPGSRSRNERGALSVGKFKSIGRLVWKRSDPVAA
jgi:hypothetical protein